MNLIEQLNHHQERLKELESRLSSQEVLSSPQKIREVNEAYAHEKEIVEIGERYTKAMRDLEGAKETLATTKDEDLVLLAEEELRELETHIPTLEQELTVALIPPDPMDKKNVIVEIHTDPPGH